MMKNVCESNEAVNIGDAITENATVFAMRIFAAGWISAVVHHDVDIDEDGVWVEWDKDFDMHFFFDGFTYFCIRYDVRDGQTQMDSGFLLFQSSMSA